MECSELLKLMLDFTKNVANSLVIPTDDPQCGCKSILKNVSKTFSDFGEKLKNLQRLQGIPHGKTTANEENAVQKVAASAKIIPTATSSAPSTSNQPNEGNKENKEKTVVTRRKKRERTSSPSHNNTASGRPKRQCTQNVNYDMVVKLTRLNPERIRSLRSQVSAEFPQAKSSAQNEKTSRYLKALRSRCSDERKSIEFERSFIDSEDSDDEVVNLKNTNRNIYYSNNLHQTLCHLCNQKVRYLVAHYVKQHSNNEVLISRPSPTMANILRSQNKVFELSNGKITGFCYFCEVQKTFRKDQWITHLLSHTGEPRYYCNRCNKQFKQKESHQNCNAKNLKFIFEKNSSNDELSGFMCTECNYLQINRDKLIKHLIKEHNYASSEVCQHIEKVILVPDISAIQTNIEYHYIEPKICLKCTICKETFKDGVEFDFHFNIKHVNVQDYTCVCKEKLTFSSGYKCLSMHLMKHSDNMYECKCCEGDEISIFSTEDELLNHISNNHTKDQWKFQHLERDSSMETITEIEIMKYICTTCSEEYVQFKDAMNHFVNHLGQMANFRTIISEKKTIVNSRDQQTTFKTAVNQYIVCQSFICSICNFKCANIEDSLEDHNKRHFSSLLNLKLGDPMVIRAGENMDKYEKINEKFNRFMTFSCYWCYTNNEDIKFLSGNVKDVFNHWKAIHSKSFNNPFRFHVETLVKCYYCDVIMTHTGLKKHFEMEHPQLTLCYVNINEHNKCPLCDFQCNSDELSAHFTAEHDLIQEPYIINPNRFKSDDIKQLLAIDVYKQIICEYCGEQFDSIEECNFHHSFKHQQYVLDYRTVVNSSCIGLLPSCCAEQLPSQNEFFKHLNEHEFLFSCDECEAQITELENATLNNNTRHNKETQLEYRCTTLARILIKIFYCVKLLFGNGIVLYMHNVLGTYEYDDSVLFERLLRQANKVHRERYRAQLEAISDSD